MTNKLFLYPSHKSVKCNDYYYHLRIKVYTCCWVKLHRELEFQEFLLGYFQNCEELTDRANGLEWEQLNNKMNEQIKQKKISVKAWRRANLLHNSRFKFFQVKKEINYSLLAEFSFDSKSIFTNVITKSRFRLSMTKQKLNTKANQNNESSKKRNSIQIYNQA